MRKDATKLTAAMRQEFEARRRREHQRVADRVLRIVGVKRHAGKRALFVDDITARDKALRAVLDDLKAWYTSSQRSSLFKNNKPLAVAIVRMVLRVANYELDERVVRSKGEENHVLYFRRTGKAGEVNARSDSKPR
jgi:hypothetical protein